MATSIDVPSATGVPAVDDITREMYRVDDNAESWIHNDAVYNAMVKSAAEMEDRLQESLTTYEQHPDVQANLQQLQYDLQSWNLALTTMTNIQKSMADALSSIASNMR